MTEEEDNAVAVNDSPDTTTNSIPTMNDDFEALLTVPIEIIFREIMQTQIISGGKRTNQRTFLFSKSEVTALLRVTMLASELTTTMTMVYEALDRVRKGDMYLNEITNMEAANTPHNHHPNNGYLRALLPIIAINSQTANDALTTVTSDTHFSISRILQELDDCAIELSKFSETNFNMADQLDWTMTAGQCSVLSREKRAIAEIEEAVVARITCLKEMAIGSTGSGSTDEENVETTTTNDMIETTESNDNNDEHDDRFIPMRDLCHKIFKQQNEKTEYNLNTSSSEHSQSQITAAEAMTSLSKEG